MRKLSNHSRPKESGLALHYLRKSRCRPVAVSSVRYPMRAALRHSKNSEGSLVARDRKPNKPVRDGDGSVRLLFLFVGSCTPSTETCVPRRVPQEKDSRNLESNLLFIMVGARGFEPPTTCTPCRYATRLRYAPKARDYSRRPDRLSRTGGAETKASGAEKVKSAAGRGPHAAPA